MFPVMKTCEGYQYKIFFPGASIAILIPKTWKEDVIGSCDVGFTRQLRTQIDQFVLHWRKNSNIASEDPREKWVIDRGRVWVSV